MTNETDSGDDGESNDDRNAPADRGADDASTEAPLTSGHVERTVLDEMLADDGRYAPTTVGGVLDAIAAVIERGDYGNLGMRNEAPTVRQSSVRRTFTQLADKGLVERVDALDASLLGTDRYALGELEPDGDPSDPTAYANVSDDARVTDWVLTDAGRAELRRLDAAYEAELDALAARYGRAHGETTDRIDA